MSETEEEPQVEDLAVPAPAGLSFISVYSPEGHLREVDSSTITSYNFRQPGLLSQKDTTQFSIQHQKFASDLSARLATFLRMDVTCARKSVRCSSIPFKTFCEGVSQPTHLTVFQFDGLDGAGVLDLRPSTSISIANRLLGGTGVATDVDRNPTEIEIALLDDVVLMILREWSKLFETSCKPRIAGHETGCRFLQIAGDDTPCFVFKCQIIVGVAEEVFQIGVPFTMLDGLTSENGPASKASPEVKQKPMHWRSPYAAIEVPIMAGWDVRTITLGEAAAIAPGDLIHLPQELIDQTKVIISQTEEFYGTIGVEEGFLAVHLNERIVKE
jgi:flagellar motor switch protein FliM